MPRTHFLLVAAALSLLATSVNAEPPAQPSAALKATLSSASEAYALDPAQQGEAFRKRLSEAKEKHGKLPTPPAVDMVLSVSNTGDRPITLHIGGDESQVSLELKGEGAVSMETMVMMTMDYRQGKPVTLAPGKSFPIPIKSLAYGTRGISHHAYWTEPGEYMLSATLTAQTPAQEQPVQVKSAPIKVMVQAAK
jgi:hypothetical protein